MLTSVLWLDAADVEADAARLPHELHPLVLPDEPVAGRDDAIRLLPHYHRRTCDERR
jgi:hypothetical protein